MVINFLIHPDCVMEVAGMIINVIKSKLKYVNIDIETHNVDSNNNIKPGIVIIIAKSFDELYDTVLINELVDNASIIVEKIGLCTGYVEPPLTELDSFKIYTMDGIDYIVKDVIGIINAAEEKK